MTKSLLKFLFIILFIGVLNNVYAGTYVAKATGSWKDATNWSGPIANHIPTFGDIAIIPSTAIITYSVVNTAGNLSLGYEPWNNPTIYVFGQLKLHADAAVVNTTTESEGPFLDNNNAKVLFFSGSTLTDDTYAGLIFTATNSFYFYTGSHFVVGSTNAFASTIFQYDNDGPDVDDPSNVEFVNRSGPFTVIATREGVADAVSNTEPPAVAPAAATDAATNVSTSSATLNGEIFSTAVQTTGIIFRYSIASDLSSSLTTGGSSTTVALNSANQTITANLTGLVSGQTYYYRIEGTNTTATAVGDIQTFTIPCTPPTVTGNPPNRTTCNGGATTFTVSGTNVTAYQWQVNSGLGFTDLSDGGAYSGTATSTLHVSPAMASMSGFTYRARLVNGVGSCTVNSNAATLTVDIVTVVNNGITNVSCFGGSNGAAVVNVTSGIGPFTYSWSPAGGSGSSASALPAGTYTVFVTDNINCTGQVTFVIGQPSAPVSGVASLNTNVTTRGGSNGSVTVAASGGTAGYTYAWSPSGGNGTTASGLATGTYKVLITDINSCASFSNNVTVFEPAATPTASAISGTGFTATWSAETGATGYRLDVSADGFNTFVSGYNDLPVSGTSQVITGLTGGATYSYRVRYVNSGGTSPNSTTGTQVTNTPPTIAGTVSQQGVNDNATINPFSGVVISDAETTQTQTLTVSLDDAAKGTFTTLNGFTNAGGGVYTFSGTAAAAQTAIRGLVFTPTPNRTPHGGTETTTFTISVNDGIAATVTDNSTSVISISVNGPPVIAGTNTLTYHALDAATAVSSALTLTDPEDNSIASATVSISDGFVSGDILSATTAGTNISASYAPGTGILTLTGSDPIAHYQQVLQSVSYFNASGNPTANGTNPTRGIAYVASDGDLGSSIVKSTINITASNDATLSGLTLSSGTLSPNFDGGTTTYTASTTATSITVTPTKTDADALLQIQLNGGGYTDIASGTASSDLSLATGSNTINLKLVAPDGTLKTYTTTVTRKIQPIVTMQPATGSQAVFVDAAPAALTVAASGGTGLTYKWYSNTTASNTGGTPVSLPIGTSYAGAGGKVGYILQPGDPGYVAGQISGIIVAPTDAGDGAEWGCQGTSVGTSFNIGSGLANTNAMISSCSTPGTAARLARAYNANGFNDWFLPSYNEMNQFYNNRAAIGGFANSGYYWTSSQFNGSNAYGAGFDNGDNGLGFGTKSDGDRVRAARYFNIADTFAPLSATTGTTYYYVIVTNSDGLSVTSDVSGPVAVSLQPVITATGTLSVSNTTYGTAVSSGSLNISGNNLTADVTVTAPAGFEVSTDASSGYANHITLTASGGAVSSTPVFVRLAPTAIVGTYSGNVTITSTGATEVDIPTISSSVAASPITVTADVQTKVYGDADPILTYQITSGALANGDVFAGTLTRDAGDDVGTYAITQGTLALSDNYILTYAGANLTITNATLTGPILADASFTYDGTPKSLVAQNVPDGASVSYTGNGQINVGGFSVTATISKLNYDDLVLPAVITITNATFADVTLPAASYTYDGSSKSLAVAGAPDGATIVYSGNDQTNAGVYSVTATISEANYNNLTLTENLTINAQTIAVTTDAKSKTYGADDPELTYSATPALTGSDTFSGALNRTNSGTLPGEQFGNYAISQGSLTAGSNYQLAFTGNTLHITAATLTISADPKSKAYGTADPTLTYTTTGLVNGTADGVAINDANILSGTLARVTGEQPGTYAIAQGTLTANSNYAITYNVGNFDITPTIANEAELSSLLTSVGTVSKVSSTAYTITVSGLTVNTLHLKATTTDPRTTLTINGNAATSNVSTPDFAINTGATPTLVPIVILAEDGITTKTVQVTINHTQSSNADLKSLALKGGLPITQTDPTSYTATLAATQVFAIAAPADAGASLRINGALVATSTYSNPILLTTGANTVTIVVTAEDGTTKTYTLTITKLPSSNADLKSLALKGGTAVTQATASTYTATTTAQSVVVLASTMDAGATLKVNGATVASGAYTDPINLVTGSNTITTVVTAEDGTTKTYTLTVTKLPSGNADLKSLLLKGGTAVTQATPTTFTATTTAQSVVVVASVMDAGATLKVNGTTVASGAYTDPINLVTGSNTITTVVTAEDGTAKTYTLTVTKLPSGNADLKSLLLKGGLPVTQTTPTTFTATTTVQSVVVVASAIDAGATLKVNGTMVTSGAYTDPINLVTGSNTITTVITAEDGTTKTYTLTVTRVPSSNADLKSLLLKGGTPVTLITPTTYTATTTATQIVVVASVMDANATLKVNGTSVAPGAYTDPINLVTGTNTVTTVVTAEDGSTKTYTLTITRQPSGNADLKGLASSVGTLAEVSSTAYTITINGLTVNKLHLRALTADLRASLTINNVAATSGVATADFAINTGTTATVIPVVIVAEDGVTTTTVQVTVNHVASSNADLKSLLIKGGLAITQTTPGTYTATTTATQVVIIAATADAGATLKINGATVASGAYTNAINLVTGTNTITTVVTAEDGTTKTYTLTVTRQPSGNADLKGLALAGGITPTQQDPLTYTASVTTATVSIRAVAADANATVKINGTTLAPGSYSIPMNLATSVNTITILITAEDGTTKTYTLTVTTTTTASLAAIAVTGDETLNIPPASSIIPANILSPNGDGKNDTWIIKDIDYYPNNTVTIYDHAGKVVYKKKGYSNEWDGSTGSGAPLPQGTYYYILKLSPDITAIKGFISILRSN